MKKVSIFLFLIVALIFLLSLSTVLAPDSQCDIKNYESDSGSAIVFVQDGPLNVRDRAAGYVIGGFPQGSRFRINTTTLKEQGIYLWAEHSNGWSAMCREGEIYTVINPGPISGMEVGEEDISEPVNRSVDKPIMKPQILRGSEPNRCFNEWDWCNDPDPGFRHKKELWIDYWWERGWCEAAVERGFIEIPISECVAKPWGET